MQYILLEKVNVSACWCKVIIAAVPPIVIIIAKNVCNYNSIIVKTIFGLDSALSAPHVLTVWSHTGNMKIPCRSAASNLFDFTLIECFGKRQRCWSGQNVKLVECV